MRKDTLLAMLIAATHGAFAQISPESPFDPERYLAFEADDEHADWRAEHLAELAEHPLELNTASSADLGTVPGFDRDVVLRLLERRRQRRLTAIDELLTIEGLDERLLDAARPFIRVEAYGGDPPGPRWSGCLRSGAEASVRAVPAPEFRGAGSRWKIVHRLMLERTERAAGPWAFDVDAATVIEKDAFEPRWADHISAFLRIRTAARTLELIVGDFALDGGLGLGLGSRGTAMKSSDVLGCSRWKSLAIRPTASASEFLGLRGIALACRTGPVEAAAFYSNRGLHARLDTSSVITSLYDGGLFRTPSEEAMRLRTRERALGLRAALRLGDCLRLGASAVESRFLHILAAGSLGDHPERRFAVLSADASLELRRLAVAADVARDAASKSAAALTVAARLSRTVAGLIVWRSVAPGFVSRHGFPMADRAGDPQGESGIYLGLRWNVRPGVAVRIYIDQFRTQGGGPAGLPATAVDCRASLEASVTAAVKLELQAREKEVRGDALGQDELGRAVSSGQGRSTRSARLALASEVGGGIRLKSQCELREVRPGHSEGADRGFLMTHEVSWNAPSHLALTIRATSFEADSYLARLYGWEPSVGGAPRQIVFTGGGFRLSALARVALRRAVVAELQYSDMEWASEEVTTRGPAIRNTERHQLSAQLEIRF